ncbi:hypothetical protein NPIL_6641 [Nephila pilipes]|uniref:Secreted protein n=1 Tax=Nephila pilipes TaxID=299642 RepID=A0A8X6UFN7_NEPPI|nr:hypothetical protein NPIL_6641 [Nephila pilipes]
MNSRLLGLIRVVFVLGSASGTGESHHSPSGPISIRPFCTVLVSGYSWFNMLIHFPKTSSRSIKALQDPQQTLRIANPILLHEEWGQGDWILSLESQHSCRSLPP